MLLRQRAIQDRYQPRRARRSGQDDRAAHRIALVRHGGRAALAWHRRLQHLRHLGLHQQRDVARHLAEAAADQGQPAPGLDDAVALRMPGQSRQRKPQRLAEGRGHAQPVLAERGQSSGRAAELQHQQPGAQLVQALPVTQQGVEPASGLEPERDRSRLLQPSAAGHWCVAVRAHQNSRRLDQPLQLAFKHAEGLACLQHQARVDDVLAGCAPVDEVRRLGIAVADSSGQRPHDGDGYIAITGRGNGERRDIEVLRPALGGDGADRRHGHDADLGLGLG